MEASMRQLIVLSCLTAALAFSAAPAHAANVTYTYDLLSRLTQVAYDNGTTIVYAYDNAGNRTTVTVTCGTGGC
jgi:YD repeat-containing protein